MKLLVTGICGTIGSVLAQRLSEDHQLIGLDLRPSNEFETVVTDLADADALPNLFRGVDVVIHLAAERRHEPSIGWDLLMPHNVVSTANVFQAAHQSGVRRVVFASSLHVMGMYELQVPYRSIVSGRYDGIDPEAVPLITADMPVRPDGRYAATKAFGESLGRYYAEAEAMEVVCVRLGTTGDGDRPGNDARSYVTWFSHRDIASFFTACVERPCLRYEILYGVSANKWKVYDTPRAWDVLGFTPSDNAETFRPA